MLKVTKVWVHKYNSGKLLGFADVQFSFDGTDENHMTWRGFKLFQGDDGSVQIGLPQRKDEKNEKDDAGNPKYYPVITVAKEEGGGIGSDFLEHMRSEIENAYLAANSETPKNSGGSNAGEVGDDLPF